MPRLLRNLRRFLWFKSRFFSTTKACWIFITLLCFSNQMRKRKMHPKLNQQHLKVWQWHRCLVGWVRSFKNRRCQLLPVVPQPWHFPMFFANSGEKDAQEAPIQRGCTCSSVLSKLLLVFFFWEAAITLLLRNQLLDCWWCPICFLRNCGEWYFSVLSCNWILLVDIGEVFTSDLLGSLIFCAP